MLPFLIRSFFAFTQVSQTYYVSPNGNDTNDSTSPAKAWKSIEKVNQIALKVGNKGLFEGGKTFYGTLRLDENDGGSAFNKLHISTYGHGKATIKAGDEGGILVHNTLFC